MISFLIAILSGALGALFYRMRGGFNPLSWGTTVTRIVCWGLPVGACDFMIALAHGATLGSAGALGVLALLFSYVSLLEDQSAAIDNDKPIEDALQMAQIGSMRAAAIALPVAWGAPLLMLLPFFGALAGLGYWAGWRYLDGRDSGIHWWGRVFACGGGEWGEVLTGAALGFGLGFLGSL